MKDRIHLMVREDEKERYRTSAKRSGLSLSEWLRDAAAEKLARESHPRRLDTVGELRAFFAECDARHAGQGREPDWEEQKKLIEASMRSGSAGAEHA